MIQDKTAIGPAATVVVLRERASAPKVLMGQRGAQAAVMPNKFVFPGGAVDPQDAAVPLLSEISSPCKDRLSEESEGPSVQTLCAAAIRELFEETGQILGKQAAWPDPVPDGWQAFATEGYRPIAEPLQFVFRAITPPGRPRRFDARFFLLDAAFLQSDLDDFSAASDELSHLQWVPLEHARSFDLPFITEVVMAEIAGRLDAPAPPDSVPFFKNKDEESQFLRFKGRDVSLNE